MSQAELPFGLEEKDAAFVFAAAWGLEETADTLGVKLRDLALAQSRLGREARIQEVRDLLVRCRWVDEDLFNQVTGDDVMRAVELLGFNEGDCRWTGNVLKGWDKVTPTVNFVPSRRKERHGAPLRVWRWK